jgi:sugar phosphate isomerase/epimerase
LLLVIEVKPSQRAAQSKQKPEQSEPVGNALMSNSIFHSSIEGAQHGPKGLAGFAEFACLGGAVGFQPSNFHLQKPDGKGFLKAKQINETIEEATNNEPEFGGLDGVSCHCPFWVLLTAWTGSPTIRPFIPPDVAKMSPEKIEKWAEDYILRFLDLCAELGVKIIPMFWGVSHGWEMATGYPWGFWEGPGYNLLKEGDERFVKKTAKIRKHARGNKQKLAHEIHPGTAASCADDFNRLVKICDNDRCLGVNADPSHCWEGEDWETRFLKVGPRVYAAHIKDMYIRGGLPLRSMEPDWQRRAMQFVNLGSGVVNMHRYAELLVTIGYPQRHMKITGKKSAPLVVEAESAVRDLDTTSVDGIAYVNKNLTFPIAGGSFEKGMGEKK